MLVGIKNRPSFSIGLFLYGGLMHLVMWRILVYRGASQLDDMTFHNHPVTNATIAGLGALFAGALFSLLREQVSHQAKVAPMPLVLKAGLFGVVATFLASGSFYLLAALALTYWGRNQQQITNPAEYLVLYALALLPMMVFGVIIFMLCLPLSFLGGLGAGFLILWNVRSDKV